VNIPSAEDIAAIVRREVEPLRLELARLSGNQGGDLLTLPDAARRLGVTSRTVQRWAKEGSLEVVRIGGSRRVRLPSGAATG
jgi:excisionase family DNA binding protein